MNATEMTPVATRFVRAVATNDLDAQATALEQVQAGELATLGAFTMNLAYMVISAAGDNLHSLLADVDAVVGGVNDHK